MESVQNKKDRVLLRHKGVDKGTRCSGTSLCEVTFKLRLNGDSRVSVGVGGRRL